MMNDGTGKFPQLLNIHLLVDRRIVSDLGLAEKKRALKEMVEYGKKTPSPSTLRIFPKPQKTLSR
jgi:hypothetical protein